MSGTLIVSLDFELYWGVKASRPLEAYIDNILGARKAIPRMLELFSKHDIHATWAAVGLMFAEDRQELLDHLPSTDKRPTYNDMSVSTYECMSDIGENEKDAPWFYAISLIKKIAETEGQEIASHTFSHYFCREPGQTIEQFETDMLAAKQIGEEKGFGFSSVVLPRNQCEPEYTDVLTKLGFKAYRDEENDWIHEKIKIKPVKRLFRLLDVYFPLTGQGGYIPQYENGIWNLVGSRMYKPYFHKLRFMEKLKIRRIKKQMLHAAKKGLTFHLWWHPHNVGIKTDLHMKQLEEIFSYYDVLREKYGMNSMNMRETVETLENK